MSQKQEKVILRKIQDYKSENIESVIESGLRKFKLLGKIRGNITIKPNLVLAHPKVAPVAFTGAEFIDGRLSVHFFFLSLSAVK